MLYMILCHDKPDSLELRQQNRPAHLDYINGAADRLRFVGPILTSDENPQPAGSLLVIEAASEMAVRLFAENDPYATAGLFASVEIRPWKAVTGTWVSEDA